MSARRFNVGDPGLGIQKKKEGGDGLALRRSRARTQLSN